MTATDELRAMLDERGVEWESGTRYYVTHWSDCERHFTAVEQDSKLYVQYSIGPLTLAQAIAATMGDSDATQSRQDDAIDDALIQIADWYHDHLSEYAEECEIDEYGGLYWVIGRDVSDDLDNLIIKAQNLAATLGADEYAIEHNVDGSYKCPNPKCGCVVDYDIRGDDERIITMDDYVIPFNFCPKCGRRIIDQDARDLLDAIASDDGRRYSMQEVMEIMEDGE